MWPFTPKTLYDRYSKLMKLIMSINSHFEITEKNEQSVRLHLSNYKGNKPIDFHIYLLESLLFISFKWEIEGEKVSVIEQFHESIDQQDMFNIAMSSILNQIHLILQKKYKNNNEKHEKVYGNSDMNCFDYDVLNKKHLLSELRGEQNNTTKGEDDYDNQTIEITEKNLSVSNDDIANAWTDEYGVKYSADRKRLLKAPNELYEYSIKPGTVIICNHAFSSGNVTKKNKLINIVFPDSLREIGESAFEDCKELVSVTIPNSVLSIGNRAFFYCSNLKSVIISDKIKQIGELTFSGCKELTSVNIPKSVKKISSCAFYNCIKLNTVNLPDGLETIDKDSFARCVNLSSISLPNSVRLIGDNAFEACSFQSINIPEGVVEIGKNAFADCKHLHSVTLADSVEKIGQGAFFTGTVMPYFYIRIGQKSKFKKIIPQYEERLCEREDEENLITEVTDKDLETAWVDEQGVMYSANKKRLLKARKDITSYTVGLGVATICDCAFKDCENLHAIILPKTIIKIGECAFQGCSSLMNVTMPKSISNIGDFAFASCTSLVSVSILSSPVFGNGVFTDCKILESIYIPSWSGTIDLYECNDLLDRTKDYPFISSWSIQDFIEKHGVIRVEEGRDAETGKLILMLINSFGIIEAHGYYYWGGEKHISEIINNNFFRIGQDANGDYWFYDKTLDFWPPGMCPPY